MSYISTGYGRLETDLGTLVVWCNGTDDNGLVMIGFRTEHEHNRHESNAPAGGWDGIAETVTVNRVDYNLHGHVRVSRDSGELVTERGYGGPGSMLRRAELFSLENGSESAERKAWEAVSEALTLFVVSDEGREFIRAGVYTQANNERDRLEQKEAELLAELKEAQAQIRFQTRKMARNQG